MRALAAFPGKNGPIAFGAFERVTGETAKGYSVHSRGGRLGSLTGGSCSDRDPAWSPDARRLAFERGRRIFTMSARGRELDPVTRPLDNQTYDISDSDPAYFASGRRLVFVREFVHRGTSVVTTDLFSVRTDGSGLRRLTATPANEDQPVPSPDGDRLAFVRGGVWVAAADGSGAFRVDGFTDGRSPDRSPDGNSLAFIGLTGGPTAPLDGYEVFIVRADGTGLTPLTATRRNASSSSYSPAGERIAFVRHGRLWTIRTDGGGLREIPTRAGGKRVRPFTTSWGTRPGG